MKRTPILFAAIFLLVPLAIAACGRFGIVERAQPENSYFLPPTPVEASSGAPGDSLALAETAQAQANQATPTVQCKDSLTFLKDITIPDGTPVIPDSTLDKRWLVENSGNCNWTQEYRVRMISGTELNAQKEQALFPARSGSQATVRMVFKAPLEPGTYRSAWQAYNPQGEPFGDPFFIEIKVETP